MTRALGAAVVVLAVALIVAVEAPGAKKPSFATNARVAALEAKVTKLTKTVNAVTGQLSCIQNAVPVGRFGNPPGNEGYLYANSTTQQTFLATALDIDEQPDANTLHFVAVDASCISAMRVPSVKAAHHRATLPLRLVRFHAPSATR